MKVLHIISSGGMYGAEAVILNLSRTLNEGPHQSVLGVFSNSSHPNLQLHARAAKEGIESHLISCNGQLDRSVPAAIRDLVTRTGADVVHAHGYKADVYVYLAMRTSQTPIVSTCHGWIDNGLAVRLYGALDRFTLRRYSGIVAVSDGVKQRLLNAGVAARRIRLIRNGVDLKPFANAQQPNQDRSGEDHSLCVGLVGRLSHEKGIDLFLRAASDVLIKLPLIRFAIVGDGPDQAQLEELVAQLKIGASVSLLGRSEDMPAFYASLDILVSSSRQEGLPIALLEGMASGLPLVATNVGLVPDIVHNDRTGILVSTESVDALATAMLKLIQNPKLRRSYGAAAQTLIAEEYSAQRMTKEYLSLYGMVVTEHARQTQ